MRYITNVNTKKRKRDLNCNLIGFIAKGLFWETNFSVLPHRCYASMKSIFLMYYILTL